MPKKAPITRPIENPDEELEELEPRGRHEPPAEPELDPETERVQRIQEQLRETGSAEVQIRVFRILPGKGKLYLDTLRLNVEAATEYQEAITQSFGGSGEGSYFSEFRVQGRILGSATFVADGDPFPTRRTPPAAPASPTSALPPAAAPARADDSSPSEVEELRAKLRRAARRAKKRERIWGRRLRKLERRLERGPGTSPVDEAIKLMEARAPKVESPLQSQLEDLKSRLEASEKERQNDRESRLEERTAGLGRTIRALRRKLERAIEKPAEKEEDPFKEYLRFKADLEKAKLAGADAGFVDKLTKRLDEKYGDRLLEFLDAKVTEVIPHGAPGAPSSSPGQPKPSGPQQESREAFREWVVGQFSKGLVFIDSPDEVLKAAQAFPKHLGQLASITSREQLVQFVTGFGYPKAVVEGMLTEVKAASYLAILEKLRLVLAELADKAQANTAPTPTPAPAGPSAPPTQPAAPAATPTNVAPVPPAKEAA